MSSSPEGRFIVSTGSFGGSIAGLFFGFLGSLGTFFASIPILILALTLAGVSFPWVQYHDEIIETGEQFMRGEVFPIWRDTVRPIWNQIRRLINALSCFVSGANWWGYGMVQEVVFPIVRDCGPGTFLNNIFEFIIAVMNDFVVDYFIAQKFYDGPADFTNICNKWIALWTSWMDMFSCACMDLSLILRSLPIVPSVFFSEQWADPNTWCAISNFINAIMNLLSIMLTLVSQTLMAILSLISPQSPYAQVNFTRPDFYDAAEFICKGLRCLGRSNEAAIQRFWDNYIPLPFVFENFLSPIDGFLCFIVKSANWLLTFIVNIDKVFVYPADPFWETVMKPLTIENLNLVGPPSNWDPVQAPFPPAATQFVMTNYFLDTANQYTPAGLPNPVYQRLRLTESVCIFIDRAICDPENMSTACFSQSASNLLRGLDFCCLTNTVTVLAIDFTTAFIEFTYHLTSGADRFFLFLDNQPFTTVWIDGITPLARCLVSIFTLIPVVGYALQNLIVEVVCFLAAVIDFFWRSTVGLASLPYFLLEMPGTDNFLTMTDRAIDKWVSLFDKIIADTPTSALNSLCLLLNTGFPIPPIPCPSCDKVGFIPLPEQTRSPPRPKRRFYNPETGKMDSPWTLAAEAMGWQNPESAFIVTPLIHYSNYTLNPFELGKMITINSKALSQKGVLPFPDHKSVDTFFDERKDYMLGWWNDKKMCKDLKKEEAELRESRPHLWKYYKQQGKYDCKKGETYAESRERQMGLHTYTATMQPNETDVEARKRLTLYPTIPPVEGCSDPTPPCFDLCCIFRSGTKTAAHLFQALGRFFNGFVQYDRNRHGANADFPYFTGEFCDPHFNRDCFESDVIKLVLIFFENFSCLCRFLNLVVPITPDNPRPDLCCAIQRVAEFIACLLTVIINAITALAMGSSDGFSYYVEGYFFNDVSAVFDIALEIVFCACVLIRAIFPLNYIPNLREAVRFDPCCLPSALAITLVEFARLVTLTIISLATITVNDDSYCFFRLETTHGCPGTLDEIGIIQRFDAVIRSLLPVSDSGYPGSCRDHCNHDQSRNGIVPCICEILNTLIPWRSDPSKPVSCELDNLNCQTVDFCCPFVQVGFALEFAIRFISRLTVALWQPWTPLPEFAIHYMFCEEEDLPPDGYCGSESTSVNSCLYTGSMQPEPSCQCGTFSCGKLNPIIQAIANPVEGLIARCTCELFSLLDDLLVMVFESIGSSWQGCFCGPANGTLLSGPLVAEQLLRAVVGLLRKFPLPCYWQPAGRVYSAFQPPGGGIPVAANCQPDVDANCVCVFEKKPMSTIEDSWLYSFLGPTIEAMCISIGNLMCFINSIFFIPGECQTFGEKFLGSTMRWGAELALRIVAAIEGFVRQFTDPVPTCVGSDPMCDSAGNTGSYNGVSAAPLGKILTSLFTWFVDSMIGDSVVSCTRICPEGSARLNNMGTCNCWNISPKTKALDINNQPVFDLVTNGTDQFGFTLYACKYARQAVFGGDALKQLPNLQGPSGPRGLGAIVPVCQAMVDFQPGSSTYPGSCANYGLCRPDSLPVCAVPPGQGDDVYAFNLEGPIDGQLNGLIRYIACALDFGTDSTTGSAIARPMLIFNSIIWQLYGGVMRFVAAWIIFLLSFFNLGSGCDCWNYDDPEQSYQGSGATISFTRGRVFTTGFCYPCPDAHAMCGDDPKGPLVCEDHCPFFKNQTNIAQGIAECRTHLVEYSRQENWPNGATAQTLCDGSFESNWLDDRCGTTNIDCRNSQMAWWGRNAHRQSSCPIPYCQAPSAGGLGQIDYPGVPERNTYTGSINPKGPKILCSALTLVKNLLQVFDAFAAIFSTPIILPDMKRGTAPMSREEFLRENKRPLTRENRTEFLKRVGILESYPYSEYSDDDVYDDADNEITQKLTSVIEKHLRIARESKKRGDHIDMEAINDAYLELDDHLTRPRARLEKEPNYPENHTAINKFRERLSIRMYAPGHTIEHAPYTTDPHLGTLPSGPELLALAMWDYDVSDCFDDPVACACRNFDMSDHCRWTIEEGVIPAPLSKRRYARQHDAEWKKRHTVNGTFIAPKQKRTSAFKRWAQKKRSMFAGGGNEKREPEPEPVDIEHEVYGPDYGTFNNGPDQMYPEEVMSVLTETFTGQTPCDHTTCGCALEEWDTMTHETKEMWVDCVSKRIQGERMSTITSGLLNNDIMYHPQAPLMSFEHLVSGWKHTQTGLAKKNQERQKRKRGKFETAFPNLDAQLKERTEKGRHYLLHTQKFSPTSPILEAVVQADLIWYKWHIGYYEFMINETYRVFETGDWHFPTTHEAARELQFATKDLKNIMWEQPYKEVLNHGATATRAVYDWTRNVFAERGLLNTFRDVRQASDNHFKRKAILNKPRRDMLWDRFYKMPIYQWWNMPSGPRKGLFAPFLHHVRNSIENYRTHWSDSPLNFWNIDKHLQGKVEQKVRSWNNLPWKPHQLRNWEDMGRFYYGIHDKIWPFQLEPAIRERFLLGGNCRLVDKTVELTVKVTDYCSNEWMPNLNVNKRSWFQGYLNETSPFRTDTFYSNRNRYKYNLAPRQNDPDAWIRPKMKPPSKTRAEIKRALRAKVDKNVYKRAMMSSPSYTGPGGWNFMNWFYELMETLFNYMFSTDFDGWVDSVRQWLNNPNTDEADYPDVGLRYWLLFMIRCEFPDNLNCSKGVGLESAIIWVTVGIVGAFLLGAFIFPPILWPFYIISAPLIWLILVGIIGLHYSPRCLFLVPSVTGISVALPFCIADELTAFVDKYVTDCYVPLIIPACMVSGEICPVDPKQFIDIVNCQTVGISDGLQHILFLSYVALGQWALDLFLWFSQVWSWLIPGLPDYMSRTLDSFTMASDSMQCRQWWCFGGTIFSIALPLSLLILFVILVAIVIPLLISTLLSGWYWFESTPHAQGLPGYDGNWEASDTVDGPQDIIEIPESELTPENVQRWIQSVQRN